VRAAAAAGDADLHVPYRVAEVLGDGRVEAVRLVHAADGSTRDVPCDELLLQLGFKTALGPLAGWGFEVDRGSIRVDPLGRTSLDRVWACGDVATTDGKLKLIATGYAEAATVVAQAVQAIRPDTVLQPGYSTNTGVPGVVAGTP
jgi:thioredoxin reductase (NADPH)